MNYYEVDGYPHCKIHKTPMNVSKDFSNGSITCYECKQQDVAEQLAKTMSAVKVAKRETDWARTAQHLDTAFRYLQRERDAYKAALEKIANEDYRGNRPQASTDARTVLDLWWSDD